MAQYRWLQDGQGPGGGYHHAGDIASLPDDWVPPAAVEPLDQSALEAFYAAGPQPPPLVRSQWSHVHVANSVTYWKPVIINNVRLWQLTGLGAGKPPIS